MTEAHRMKSVPSECAIGSSDESTRACSSKWFRPVIDGTWDFSVESKLLRSAALPE